MSRPYRPDQDPKRDRRDALALLAAVFIAAIVLAVI